MVVGNQVVGFTQQRRGRLFGLDPTDGNVLWRGEPSWGEHASLIVWGDEVLVFREDGSLVVGKISRENFQPLHTYPLGSPGMWAHPAVVDGLILIKDGSRVVSYGLKEQ